MSPLGVRLKCNDRLILNADVSNLLEALLILPTLSDIMAVVTRRVD